MMRFFWALLIVILSSVEANSSDFKVINGDFTHAKFIRPKLISDESWNNIELKFKSSFRWGYKTKKIEELNNTKIEIEIYSVNNSELTLNEGAFLVRLPKSINIEKGSEDVNFFLRNKTSGHKAPGLRTIVKTILEKSISSPVVSVVEKLMGLIGLGKYEKNSNFVDTEIDATEILVEWPLIAKEGNVARADKINLSFSVSGDINSLSSALFGQNSLFEISGIVYPTFSSSRFAFSINAAPKIPQFKNTNKIIKPYESDAKCHDFIDQMRNEFIGIRDVRNLDSINVPVRINLQECVRISFGDFPGLPKKDQFYFLKIGIFNPKAYGPDNLREIVESDFLGFPDMRLGHLMAAQTADMTGFEDVPKNKRPYAVISRGKLAGYRDGFSFNKRDYSSLRKPKAGKKYFAIIMEREIEENQRLVSRGKLSPNDFTKSLFDDVDNVVGLAIDGSKEVLDISAEFENSVSDGTSMKCTYCEILKKYKIVPDVVGYFVEKIYLIEQTINQYKNDEDEIFQLRGLTVLRGAGKYFLIDSTDYIVRSPKSKVLPKIFGNPGGDSFTTALLESTKK